MFLRSSMFPSSGGQKATRSIVNRFSSAGWSPQASMNSGASNGAIVALSGSMTANTLKTLLSVSGVGGFFGHLSFFTNDATARTIRIKITIDGFVAFDFTSASISASNSGCYFSGASGTSTVIMAPIKWNSTALVEYASSLTETDKITTNLAYNTEA